MKIELNPIKPVDDPIWSKMESITISNIDEPLVPVSISSHIKCYPVYYKMGVSQSIPECFVRKSIFEKLLLAAERLPNGINLVILDGWRPYSVQEYLYETLLNKLKHKPENTQCSHAELVAKTRKVVSPPSTELHTPSPHLTGGAVDVTLCDDFGRMLDMGTLFDENSPLSRTCALEELSNYPEAKHNRRLLYQTMTSVGFSNLPSEWWHYDFGDQLWAYYHNKETAIYGATQPITLEFLWRE